MLFALFRFLRKTQARRIDKHQHSLCCTNHLQCIVGMDVEPTVIYCLLFFYLSFSCCSQLAIGCTTTNARVFMSILQFVRCLLGNILYLQFDLYSKQCGDALPCVQSSGFVHNITFGGLNGYTFVPPFFEKKDRETSWVISVIYSLFSPLIVHEGFWGKKDTFFMTLQQFLLSCIATY